MAQRRHPQLSAGELYLKFTVIGDGPPGKKTNVSHRLTKQLENFWIHWAESSVSVALKPCVNHPLSRNRLSGVSSAASR